MSRLEELYKHADRRQRTELIVLIILMINFGVSATQNSSEWVLGSIASLFLWAFWFMFRNN